MDNFLKPPAPEWILDTVPTDALIAELLKRGQPHWVVPPNTTADIVRLAADGEAFIFRVPLAKSFSSHLSSQYPGGRWITVKNGALAGRHIFISPHADGKTASIIVGGGPAMAHKKIAYDPNYKAKRAQEAAAAPTGGGFAMDAPAGGQSQASDEKRAVLSGHKAALQSLLESQRTAFADKVKETIKLPSATTVPIHEAENTLRRIVEAAPKAAPDPLKQAAPKAADPVKDQINEVVKLAKAAVMGEHVKGDTPALKSLNAQIKDHAEELLAPYYAIKANEKQLAAVNRALRSPNLPMLTEKPIAFEAIQPGDVEKLVADEKAREAEIDAHYQLVVATYGGIDQFGLPFYPKGQTMVAQNVGHGGFEALTGATGLLTGTTILNKKDFTTLGPRNAAIITAHYLATTLPDFKDKIGDYMDRIDKRFGEVAVEAVNTGDQYRQRYQQIKRFGGDLLEHAAAQMTANQYLNQAYAAYGQAEGALNFMAELSAAAQETVSGQPGAVTLVRDSETDLQTAMRRIGLRDGDYQVEQYANAWRAVIPAESFGKVTDTAVLSEDFAPTVDFTGKPPFTAGDIKQGLANTAEFMPSMIKPYFEGAGGDYQKTTLAEHQQAGARLIGKLKRGYFNFEAGTGKTLAYLTTISHVSDLEKRPIKALVSMPKGIIDNFIADMQKFSLYEPVVLTDDWNKKITDGPFKGQKPADLLKNPPDNAIFITNEDAYNFRKKKLKDAGFDMVIADEAHQVTKRRGATASDRAAGLQDVAKTAKYFIAGTGTPTPNDLGELFYHLHTINPKKFSDESKFLSKYERIHSGAGFKRELAEVFNKEVGDHLLTAKKQIKGVSFNLKPHYVELTTAQKAKYRQIISDYKAGKLVNMAGKPDALRRDQLLAEAIGEAPEGQNNRYNEIKTIVDDHLAKKSPNEKVNFFVLTKKERDHLETYLQAQYPQYQTVHFGGDQAGQFGENADKLRRDPATKFAIVMPAGKTGLNLQYNDPNAGGVTTAIAMGTGQRTFADLDQFFARAYRTGAIKNIDGHLIFSNTPLDLRTDERIQSKKRIGKVLGKSIIRLNFDKAVRAW